MGLLGKLKVLFGGVGIKPSQKPHFYFEGDGMKITTQANIEKRRHPRLAKSLPVRIKSDRYSSLFEAPAQNISRGGMMLELSSDRFSRLTSSADLDVEFSLPLIKTPLKTRARIIWIQRSKVGIRFVEIRPQEKTIISLFIQKELKPAIKSELVKYPNRQGKEIIGFFDHLESEERKPIAIISPSYGETKKSAIMISYHLVINGFNVIRYDNTDHVGESEGEMIDFTLLKAKEDLLSTIDFVKERFGARNVIVVASSLANRATIKAAAEDERIKLLVGLAGVVNLQYTLNYVYKEDLVGNHVSGKRWGITDILGHDIDFDNFLSEAVRNKFSDLETTKEDMEKVTAPYIYFFAEKEAWVSLEEAREIVNPDSSYGREFHVISDAMHELYENPKATRLALEKMVGSCLRHVYGLENMKEVLRPDMRQVVRQNRLERERLKTYELTKEGERDFWGKYLSKYLLIEKSADYRQYLELMVSLLGLPKENEIILDVGCGPGHFGAWLLRDLAKTRLTRKPCTYVGIDFVENVLKEAKEKHEKLQRRFREKYKTARLIDFRYMVYDLEPEGDSDKELQLPFQDNYFDKICCSLFLSYVKNPQLILTKLFRVLKPRGRIVVTSLKPYCDLSQIYRNFVDQTESDQEIEDARDLLRAAGRIKEKEYQGHYRFFSEKELISLLTKAEGKAIRVYRSFANQANVASAEK